MNAKQFLKQAYKLNEIIENDKEELENLRSLAESISNDISQERVQTSVTNDKTVNIIAQIVDLENEIYNEIKDLIALKKKIRDAINQLDDVNEKLVLKNRYLLFLQWDELCEKMNYSRRQMFRIHDLALEKIEVPIEFKTENGT